MNADSGPYVGGLRRGSTNWTWPFAELTVTREGIHLESHLKRPRLVWRVIGVRTRDFAWEEIQTIDWVYGLLPLSSGIRLKVKGPRLIFWAMTDERAQAVLA